MSKHKPVTLEKAARIAKCIYITCDTLDACRDVESLAESYRLLVEAGQFVADEFGPPEDEASHYPSTWGRLCAALPEEKP